MQTDLNFVTIEVPVQDVFLDKIDQLRGHLSRGEWALTLIQRECHDPQARMYAKISAESDSEVS